MDRCSVVGEYVSCARARVLGLAELDDRTIGGWLEQLLGGGDPAAVGAEHGRSRVGLISFDDMVAEYSIASEAVMERGGDRATQRPTLRALQQSLAHATRALTAVADHNEATSELRVVANSVPIHLLHISRDERILFANRVAAAMWRTTPEKMIGKTIGDIVGAEAARVLSAFTQRVLEGEIVSYEAPFTLPTGKVRRFLNTYSPDVGPDGEIRGFVATGTDITDRTATEEQLRETVQRLQKERAMREQFVATLSHDLRTPLSAARMGADMIPRLIEEPTRLQNIAARISSNIDRADGMIRDLLDVTRIKAGEELPLERGHCALDKVVRDALDDLISVHGDRFVLEAPQRVEGNWSCDGIRRMVENLANNAVKYGGSDRITVMVGSDASRAELAVHNAGNPIPREQLEVMFEPFKRLTAEKRGWGLGLPLVKGIAEAHGGSVSVTSSREAGTVFRVLLPFNARATTR